MCVVVLYSQTDPTDITEPKLEARLAAPLEQWLKDCSTEGNECTLEDLWSKAVSSEGMSHMFGSDGDRVP